MRGKSILLPKAVIPLLKEIEAERPNITGYSTERMKYLIHTIITHKQKKEPGSYSKLLMKYLRNVVPEAHKYLNLLKDKGALEWVNYLKGRNSRLYRLTKKYDSSEVVHRTLTDMNLCRRIEKVYNRIKLKNSKKYPILNRYVHSVTIDYPAALKTIEETYRRGIESKNEKVKKKANGRRTYSLGEVEKIHAGEIMTKVNSTNGRYDSNFTRLPGELVQHLTINGKGLIEIDIANSQPFFAATILNPSEAVNSTMQKLLGERLTMRMKTLHISEKEDVKRYQLLVVKGKFYEYISELFDANNISYTSKKDLKDKLFGVFFDKNASEIYNPGVRAFKKDFPNVYNLFTIIKEKEYNKLAILLQRIESHTILDHVVPAISEAFPGLPFITKHDSILPAGLWVPEKADEVAELVGSKIFDVVGLRPVCRVKESSISIEGIYPYTSSNTPLPTYTASLYPYDNAVNR